MAAEVSRLPMSQKRRKETNPRAGASFSYALVMTPSFHSVMCPTDFDRATAKKPVIMPVSTVTSIFASVWPV